MSCKGAVKCSLLLRHNATSSDAAALPNSIHTSSCATPTGSVATSTLKLTDPPVRDVSSTSLLSSGACVDSSDLATLLFGPLPSEALTFHLPQPDEESSATVVFL